MLPGPEELRLRVGGGEAGDLADLLNRAFLQVEEGEQERLVVGQGLQGLGDDLLPVFCLQEGRRALLLGEGDVRRLHLFVIHEKVLRAERTDGRMIHDLVEPRGELARPLEVGQRAVHLDERVLDDLLRLLAIAHDADSQRKGHPLVFRDEEREALPVARQDVCYPLGFVRHVPYSFEVIPTRLSSSSSFTCTLRERKK